LDVGIGFAIYLSEGTADSSVQVLNPSRYSSYTPQACERARIVFYIDYEKSGVEETANGTDITSAKCELIPAASKAIFLHSPRQAGRKTRFRPRQKYCKYQGLIVPAPRLCLNGCTVWFSAGWEPESNQYEISTCCVGGSSGKGCQKTTCSCLDDNGGRFVSGIGPKSPCYAKRALDSRAPHIGAELSFGFNA
jgi:hypothetical protein